MFRVCMLAILWHQTNMFHMMTTTSLHAQSWRALGDVFCGTLVVADLCSCPTL